MNPATIYVLDAGPIVEWLLGKQPAAKKFTQFLNASEVAGTRLLITRLNRCEILYTLAKRLSKDDQAIALQLLELLSLEVISIDDDLLDRATELKKRFACSYADCFAMALAIRLKVPVVTGDREFLTLHNDGLISLEWLGA